MRRGKYPDIIRGAGQRKTETLDGGGRTEGRRIMAFCCLADGAPRRRLVLLFPFIMQYRLAFPLKSPSEIQSHMPMPVRALFQAIIFEISIVCHRWSKQMHGIGSVTRRFSIDWLYRSLRAAVFCEHVHAQICLALCLLARTVKTSAQILVDLVGKPFRNRASERNCYYHVPSFALWFSQRIQPKVRQEAMQSLQFVSENILIRVHWLQK